MKKLLTLCMATAISFSAIAADGIKQTTGLVVAGGKPITLLGKQVYVGSQAPNFRVVNERFSPVKLSDFAGKTVMLSVVPSLDTGVCSLQTKRFNEEVANLPDSVAMLTISNDLPFAQKRFCTTETVEDITVLSDSVWRDFGEKYGLLIKDMGLLSRAIFVIDGSGKITYKELVADISMHPDYDAAIEAVKEAANIAVEVTTEHEVTQSN
ncbi:thiol peroxidase [Thalassomonas sp. M1454]|uniref:thiol peroxidase n=1 Tax=Thalassomonas sp. M1454 TaxID=2594477 RepID=UPI001180FC00|nr:thiol peroxidase [Thalassomonas sp. M1454]TRX55697.1 thiol peroxidase [Thalassomonas sp. M1454]